MRTALVLLLLLSPLAGRWAAASAPAATCEPGVPSWQTLREITRQLGTEEGTLAVLRGSTALQARYASEAFFQDFITTWRGRIKGLPQHPGDPGGEDISVEITPREDAQVASLTFHHRLPEHAITILKIVWENDQVADLLFMRGFSSVITRGGRRHHGHGFGSGSCGGGR